MTPPHRTLQWASTPDGRALRIGEYGDPAGQAATSVRFPPAAQAAPRLQPPRVASGTA
jgi:hypothetical protein